MGSWDHPLTSLSVEGSVKADGDSFEGQLQRKDSHRPGGGSGGTILLFLHFLDLDESGNMSSAGGHGSVGGGGGGGGRIHFHWSDIPTGDMYQPIATVNGSIQIRLVDIESQAVYFSMIRF